MPNIFRVTLSQLLYSQTCQNVLHFTGPSSDPAQMSALADDVQGGWIQQVRPGQVGPVKYTDIAVTLLESQFPTFHKTVNIDSTGGTTGELSTVLSLVFRLRGAIRGPHARGRVYIPGVHQNVQNAGVITPENIIGWQNRFANILALYGPGGSSTFRLVICPSKPPFNTVDVATMDIAPTLGTQRRRGVGRGI